jgi:predicted dehydrogenase
VYCEKPLARTIYETRKITEAARAAGVATQLGNHGHSGEGIRMTVEWIRDGAIGDIREVHAWIDSFSTDNCGEDIPTGDHPIPAGLDWTRWLGPAETRPYHPAYCPVNWRGWWDFGTGKLGDFGCHHMDPAFWALDLDGPVTVQASVAGDASVRRPYVETIYYDFAARGEMPPLRMVWYSGLMPPLPLELEEGRTFSGRGHGILFIGDKGKMMCGGWGGTPRLIPEAKMQSYTLPEKAIPRSNGHHRDWIDACKGGKPASSNFDYSGPLTEFVLLGVLAVRSGKRLNWDPETMQATNLDVTELVKPTYHNGWTI